VFKAFQLTIYKRDKNFNLEDFLFLLSFVAISFGFNEIAILFSVYIFFKTRLSRLQSKKIIYFLLPILISGTFLSLYNLDNLESNDFENILFRIRFYWIRIIYAITVASYLYNKSYIKILHIIYVLAMANLIIGILELILNSLNGEFSRLNMLALEPSSSSMFYLFSIPLLFIYGQYFPKKKKYIYFFFFLGLLILSKAQILVLIFWATIYLIYLKKSFLKLIVIIFVFVFGYSYIIQLTQISVMINLFNVLSMDGLQALNPQNQVWTSFTLRISSWLSAANIFITNPFGVGFGQFHLLYIEYMKTSDIVGAITGPGIDNILSGDGMYATPKSAFMELLVSSGLFFVIPFVKLSKKIFNKKNNSFIKISFSSLVLSALMVEIAPFLTFLIFIMILQHKSPTENFN